MRQTELAGLTSKTVFPGVKISVDGFIRSEGQFAVSTVVAMGIFGSKSREGKHQNQKNGDELLPFLIKRIFGEVFFHLFKS